MAGRALSRTYLQLSEEPERRQRLRRPAASPKPEITTSVSVPDIPRFAANSEEVYLARLPNFMNVEHRPFAPDTYDEEDEIARSEATGASTSVSVENTIRWRTTKNPNGEVRCPRRSAQCIQVEHRVTIDDRKSKSRMRDSYGGQMAPSLCS